MNAYALIENLQTPAIRRVLQSDPTQSVRFVREREPGTPWEIGDRFSISWDGARLDLMCTGIRDGMLVEGWSEQLQAIISFDRGRL